MLVLIVVGSTEVLVTLSGSSGGEIPTNMHCVFPSSRFILGGGGTHQPSMQHPLRQPELSTQRILKGLSSARTSIDSANGERIVSVDLIGSDVAGPTGNVDRELDVRG